MFSRMRKRGSTTWERDGTPNAPLIVSDADKSGVSIAHYFDSKVSEQHDETNSARIRSGEQRQKHNAVERRRKKAIKEAMDELVDLLPEKQNKPTQLSVLKAAIEYIRNLQQENEALRDGGRTCSPVPIKRQRLEVPLRRAALVSSSDGSSLSSSSDEESAGESGSPVPFTSLIQAQQLRQQPPVLQLPVYSVSAAPSVFNAPPPSNTTTFVPPLLSSSFLQYLQQSDTAAIAPQADVPVMTPTVEDNGERALNFLPSSLLSGNSGFEGLAESAFSAESLSSSTSSNCSMQLGQSGAADFDTVLARFLINEDSVSS